MKRYCICVLWDRKGVVYDYVVYYLKALLEICEKVFIVVNGDLTDEGREKLQSLGIDILQRENVGYDFAAWKQAIEFIGYDELEKYDELILTNTTCYGPIYPLTEMFTEMESRDCDFWGITKHPEINQNFIYNDERSKVLEHIQSYFIVYNKSVFMSKSFMDYWKNLNVYKNVNEVIGYCETKLTKYFEDAGFISDSYVDLNSHKNIVNNPELCTVENLNLFKIPLVKRKAIISTYNSKMQWCLTYQQSDILEYIKNKTDYDINMIYQDIINNQPMSEIKSNLHLNYVLPSNFSLTQSKNQKIAMILYIYYEDLVEYCFKYVQSMPKGTDIYIVSSKQTTLDVCKEKAAMLNDYNLIYRLKNNRGRDVSAYLVACSDVFEKYDLICCVHDKKTEREKGIVGKDFSYQCFECNLKSKDYVNNVLSVFENNKRIGMLTNPPLSFMGYVFMLIGNELSGNKIEMQKLFKKLSLSVPFDGHPIAPFGSMFWIRGDAIKPLFRHKWEYEDFPEEPLPVDGSISHAIERIYPAVVQEAGYLSGWIMPDTFASIYIDNLAASVVLNRAFVPPVGKMKYKPFERVFSIKNSLDKRHKILTISGLKFKIKNKKKRG